MHEHMAAAIVPGPVESVYRLFTHFHRYPLLLRCVQRVSFYDDQHCRWTVSLGPQTYEFDSINEGWRENARIGWRGLHGASATTGELQFAAIGKSATRVFVRLRFDPPDEAGSGFHGDHVLAQDLNLFADTVGRIVREGRSLTWDAIAAEQRQLDGGAYNSRKSDGATRAERGEVAAAASENPTLV